MFHEFVVRSCPDGHKGFRRQPEDEHVRHVIKPTPFRLQGLAGNERAEERFGNIIFEFKAHIMSVPKAAHRPDDWGGIPRGVHINEQTGLHQMSDVKAESLSRIENRAPSQNAGHQWWKISDVDEVAKKRPITEFPPPPSGGSTGPVSKY